MRSSLRLPPTAVLWRVRLPCSLKWSQHCAMHFADRLCAFGLQPGSCGVVSQALSVGGISTEVLARVCLLWQAPIYHSRRVLLKGLGKGPRRPRQQ